jgi:hypothetical protein
MSKIKDREFGEMEYKHSWTKKDSLIFLDKAYIVNVTAQAYKGDEILESQRSNFKNYKEILDKNSEDIQMKLKQYFIDIFNKEGSLSDLLEPKTVIFERDGSWGILFESDCDIENGVAVFIKNGEIKVGPQDELI